MTTWEEIRDEIAGMLADGKPLEDVIGKLEQRKNEMAKAELLKAMDDMKKREQTNEEWLCGLSTKKKAKFFKDVSEKCLNCGSAIDYDEIGECPFGRCRTGLNEYEDWLKEKRDE